MPLLGAALLALVISASVHFACFAKWPGSPDWDVHHSVFAAQNYVRSGQLASINLFPEWDADLARNARVRWMTHWPPAHSWLYAGPMLAGLSGGAATKLLAALCVVLGGLGWVMLGRRFGGSTACLVAIAAAYPWVSLVSRLYLDYKNDHLASAVAPWVYVALMRIEPLSALSRERWGRLLGTTLLVGLTVLIKYSLAPLLIASVAYLVWLDGVTLSRRRVLRLGAATLCVVLPGLLLWWLNRSWSNATYPVRTGEGLALSVPVFAKNLIANTVGSTTGWDLIFIQLKELWGIVIFKGVIAVVSACVAGIWAARLVATGWRGPERRFGVFLCLLTVALWATLAATVIMSGVVYDYSSGNRFYMPVGFAWIVMVALSVDRVRTKSALRYAALFSLVIPLAFSTVFFVCSGLFRRPYVPMPASGTAWTETRDPLHAAFLSDLAATRGRKPDLIVAETAQYMTELGVPCFFTFRVTRGVPRTYFSSMPMEVWAMVLPAEESVLLHNFRRAATQERIDVPPGFPFVFYAFRFVPEARAQR